MRVCVDLIMLAACTLIPGFLASYWSAGFGTILQVSALAPIGWRIEQIFRQRWRKRTNTAPTTVSAIQAARQYTFINLQLLYAPLVISGNDKNNQLTLLSQRKLTLISITTLFVLYKIIGYLKK
jgi:hypothetical protein